MGSASLATMYAVQRDQQRRARPVHHGRVTYSASGAEVPDRPSVLTAVVAWVVLMAIVATVAVVF